MRGLPPEEKALLQRIANLMDSALNNRQASNPFEPRRNKPSRVVYPPTGLTAATGIKAVKLTWNAANSNEHLRYEIEVRNVGTGVTQTKSSFTHNLTYYGAGGAYEAKVWSVGRNGRSSEPQTITFDIGADIMQVEGAKTGVAERGTVIQDDIFHMPGYRIFVWGAVVIDEYIAGSGNPNIVFKLWRKKGDDAVFATDVAGVLELVETIQLYPATEDASNLSDSALGGQEKYIRYAGTRLGSFGTSQSVMFSPIPVAADEVNEHWTYFLQAVNRETQTDEVSLSITIWAGSEGASNTQPGDPFSRSDYVFPHYNHWHTWNTLSTPYQGAHIWDSRWAVAEILEGYYIPANQWSIGFWWRPDRIDPAAQGDLPDVYQGLNWLFQKQALDHEQPYDQAQNEISITMNTRARSPIEWSGYDDSHKWVHQMDVVVRSNKGAGAGGDNQDVDVEFSVRALIEDDENGTSGLMPWSTNNSQASQNDGWYFTVVCFEGNRDQSATSKPMIRVWQNIGIATDEEDELNSPPVNFHVLGMRNVQVIAENYQTNGRDPMYMSGSTALSTRRVLQDDKEDSIMGFGVSIVQTHFQGIYKGSGNNVATSAIQWHQAGIWSVALDQWDGYEYVQAEGQASMNYLYNQGFGTEINWKEDAADDPQPDGTVFQAYPVSTNLAHLWQFGAIETSFYLHEALRDTGYHVYRGDLNFTSTINPHITGFENFSPLAPVPLTEDSWSNTGGLWDIRTPTGAGQTEQSDVCYPGQNL